jgi:hypothetical protein
MRRSDSCDSVTRRRDRQKSVAFLAWLGIVLFLTTACIGDPALDPLAGDLPGDPGPRAISDWSAYKPFVLSQGTLPGDPSSAWAEAPAFKALKLTVVPPTAAEQDTEGGVAGMHMTGSVTTPVHTNDGLDTNDAVTSIKVDGDYVPSTGQFEGKCSIAVKATTVREMDPLPDLATETHYTFAGRVTGKYSGEGMPTTGQKVTLRFEGIMQGGGREQVTNRKWVEHSWDDRKKSWWPTFTTVVTRSDVRP